MHSLLFDLSIAIKLAATKQCERVNMCAAYVGCLWVLILQAVNWSYAFEMLANVVFAKTPSKRKQWKISQWNITAAQEENYSLFFVFTTSIIWHYLEEIINLHVIITLSKFFFLDNTYFPIFWLLSSIYVCCEMFYYIFSLLTWKNTQDIYAKCQFMHVWL